MFVMLTDPTFLTRVHSSVIKRRTNTDEVLKLHDDALDAPLGLEFDESSSACLTARAKPVDARWTMSRQVRPSSSDRPATSYESGATRAF